MIVSRRTALAGMAAGVFAPTIVRGAQPIAGQQAPAFYRSKIGDWEITSIHDGVASRPLEGFIKNASLDDVKKLLGENFLPTDRYVIPFTTVVVNTGSKLILIDSGNGDSGAPTSGSWMTNFRAAGFDPAKVDMVLISHFHGDHVNGLRLKDGTAVFPNAEIKVSAPEWAFWMSDENMAKAPEGMKGAFQVPRRVFGPIAKDVTRFEWGKEVAPGITAVSAPGHTPGHTVFALQSGAAKFLMLADLTNNPQIFARRPEWQAVFDMDGDMATATRRKMLDMAATERMQVAFYHAPFPATGHVMREGNGYSLVPAFWQAPV